MSEPHEIADRVEPVVDGVSHWRISNSNLGGATSSSQAISADAGTAAQPRARKVADRRKLTDGFG